MVFQNVTMLTMKENAMKNKLSKMLFATVMATSASAALANDAMPKDGFYAGIEAGWLDGDAKWVYRFGQVPSPKTPNIDGGMGGAVLGYQKRFNNKVVLGAEVSYNFGQINGRATCPNPTFTCDVDDVDEIFTIGPRLGYMINNNWLVYLHGGYARAQVGTNAWRLPATKEVTSEHHDGWSAGVGIDYAFTNRFSVGFKYTHFDLDKKLHKVGQAPMGIDRYITPEFDTYTLRVTYTFQ